MHIICTVNIDTIAKQPNYIFDIALLFPDIFTPNFVEIKSKNVHEIASTLKKRDIKYPFVCKPLIAYGSSDAHKVSISCEIRKCLVRKIKNLTKIACNF